jgi:uncharacterized protein YyaL (SSP411 family)
MYSFLSRRFWPVFLLVIIMGSGSCRRQGGDKEAQIGADINLVPKLDSNALSGYPGAVYINQTSSPIHWQPWTRETIEKAKAAKKLLFCVITLPQQAGFQTAMKSLVNDSAALTAINNNFVPVLIDGDSSREIGLLVPDLCAQIGRQVQMPMFMWMTYECNPVAWIPVQSNEVDIAADLFSKSHEMIWQMWRDSSEYVLKNSASDNEMRRQNFLERMLNRVASKVPDQDAIRCIRQLASLYDPLSRNLDEFGGLFPSSSLELFAISARHPGVPEDLHQKCLEATQGLSGDLLPSAMFDPLDGGIFVSRVARSWALPNFSFDCPVQSRALVALLEVYRTTGDKRALDRALDCIKFAEKKFATPDGLFAIGFADPQDGEKWMWTVEEVENILGADDSAWWIKATGMERLGNLPSEDDPRRTFFRKNTIGMRMTIEEIAADLSLTPEQFRPRYEAAKAKLLAVRDARMEKQPRDECAHAGSTFRMVSAYVAAFAASGDEAYRDKAVALLKRAREAFAVGPRLRMFNKETPDSIGAGRAFLYALCLQSVLDVAAVTLDDSWLIWSEDLATTLAELFIGDSLLKECPDSASLINLPITDLAMIFDDSTRGLLSMSECRLAELQRPLVAKLCDLATPLPQYAIERPVLHADLILATLARHFKVSVIVGEGVQGDFLRAVQELTPRVIQRRMAKPEDAVPAGTVKIIFADGTVKSASSAETLRQGVLPVGLN